ncbi:Glycogen debranching enzyme [compost metagenome]
MRARLQRTLLATLLLSQGTPMLLAGDELGHSQNGNNNAYCQDNETTWLGWIGLSDPASERARLAAFVARLTALRREAPALRSARWWPAEPPADGAPLGLRWLRPDGQPMAPTDWHAGTALAILFGNAEDAWLVLVNAGPSPVAFTLPEGDWRCCLATDAEDPDALRCAPRPLGRAVEVPVSSLWLART